MIRRVLVLILLAALLAPAGAAASSKHSTKPQPKGVAWRTYSNKKLGFSLRYPGNWRLTPSSTSLNAQVLLSYSGKTPYGLTITVLPMSVRPTLGATLQQFIALQQQQNNMIFARIKWTSASVGGKPAMAGVARSPATEGGISISDAVYVTQSRSHVFQILAVSYHRPPLSQLSQFPSIYTQILKTWRFL